MRDLTPSETRAIAESVGCRVLRVSSLHDGGAALELDCRDHERKVELLAELAAADAQLPDVRRRAENVIAGAADDAEAAIRLHAHVRDHVRFVREPRETFGSTLRTLDTGLGDCDDSARALAALLLSVGLPARLATLPEGDAPPLHVAAQTLHGGRWEWLETSIAAEPGEHPLAAARRLGIDARPELGAVARHRDGTETAAPSIDLRAAAVALLAIGGAWWIATL